MSALPPPPLPRLVLDEVYRHAEAGYPKEVCGLIYADRAEGGRYPEPEVRRCENERPDAHAAFSLGARDVIALARSLSTDRPARIVYHSHADVGAYFSDEDERAAAPEGVPLYPVDHLIVDVREARARGHRLYRFQAGRYTEIDRAQR